MSERLEAIKHDWVEKQKTYQFRPLTLEMNDVNWLIEQVERVGELEIGIEYLQSNIKGLQKNIDTLRETRRIVANAHQDNLEIREVENARLREALEFYADSMLNGSEARKALAGESK